MIVEKLTRKYVLSHHLALERDLADPDQILLKNLYYGTEMTAGPEIWKLLEAHAAPATPESSWLAEQAVERRILVPEGEPAGISAYLEELEEAIDEYLRTVARLDDAQRAQLFPQADPGDLDSFRRSLRSKVEFCAKAYVGYLVFLKARLQQKAEEEQPEVSPRGEGLWVWEAPEVFCAVLFDHLWLLLDEDLGAGQGGHDARLLKAGLDRPPLKEHLYQQPCTLHTALQRAARIAEQCPPPAHVLVLGDDDLVSLALSLVSPGYRIDVMELDPDLVAFLRRHAGPGMRVLEKDLNLGLEEEYHRQYDVVVSDPPYSAERMVPFLECCALAIKPDTRARLFVSTCLPLLEDGLAFHEACSNLGFHKVRATRGFNRYPIPEHFRLSAFALFINTCRLPLRLTSTVLDQPFLYADLLEYAPRIQPDSRASEGMELVHARDSRYQEIRLYRSGDTVCLTNNGGIQFHTSDERPSHELLVSAPLCLSRTAERVLILGGGDGLAAREALRFPEVERVVLAEIDPEMIEMTRTQPDMVRVTAGSLGDPRVQVRVTDALRWVEETDEQFDLIVNDIDYLRTHQEGHLNLARLVESVERQTRLLRPGGCITLYVPLDAHGGQFLECPADEVADRFANAFRPVLKSVLITPLDSPWIGPHAYLCAVDEEHPALQRTPPPDTAYVTRAFLEQLLRSEPREPDPDQLARDWSLLFSKTSPFQRIRLYGKDDELCLTLNDQVQLYSETERAGHELAVGLPVMLAGSASQVLILGGGDGLAAREAVAFEDTERVTVVEIDEQVLEAARTVPRLAELNAGALEDPRLRLVAADAFSWLESCAESFDVIVNDIDFVATAQAIELTPADLFDFLRTQAAHLKPGGWISFYYSLTDRLAAFLGCPPEQVDEVIAAGVEPTFQTTVVNRFLDCNGAHVFVCGSPESCQAEVLRAPRGPRAYLTPDRARQLVRESRS